MLHLPPLLPRLLIVRQTLLSVMLVCFTLIAHAAEETVFSRPHVPALTTELVMELEVAIGTPVTIGESDLGVRRFIPITGGTFEGRGIRGEVIEGGADWQLVRPDGVTEIRAVYAIRTDDGAVIAVENVGIAVNVAAEDTTPASRYVRTQPVFKAPQGNYQWLNERFFTGTITVGAGGRHVIIRVFEGQ